MESESNITEQVLKIYSQDMATQLEGVVAIRRLLSVEEIRWKILFILLFNFIIAPINEVISSGVVPALLELMKPYHDEQFQFESCWAVTNICSGTSEHVQYIVSLGGLDLIMDLLNSKNAEIAEQAIWALANIIGDSPEYRNLCLEKDVMNKIVSIFNKFPDNQNLQENCLWALSNFLTVPPACAWDKISNGVAVLKNMLVKVNKIKNKSTLADALWSVSRCSKAYVQEIIDFDFVPDLIHHLQNDKQEIILPALSALDNIISGSASQIETVLSFKEFVPRLFQLLCHQETQIRTNACYIVGKAVLFDPKCYELILENPNWLQDLQKVIQTDITPPIKFEENNLIHQLETLSIYQNESIDRFAKTDEDKQKMEQE